MTSSTRPRGAELTRPTPCDGSVLRLAVNAPGAVVQDGEMLAELACAGEQLQAEVQRDAPGTRAHRAGPARCACSTTRSRTSATASSTGTVRWVSPASVTVKDRQVFRVLVDLEEHAVRVKGETRPLMAGMGGRADVVVGRRSLISYAFEPIRMLRETLADRAAPTPPAR